MYLRINGGFDVPVVVLEKLPSTSGLLQKFQETTLTPYLGSDTLFGLCEANKLGDLPSLGWSVRRHDPSDGQWIRETIVGLQVPPSRFLYFDGWSHKDDSKVCAIAQEYVNDVLKIEH